MGPDPTQAFFWPAVNKRLTSLQPGYFLTQPEEIFFDPRAKDWKFDVFRGNFPNLHFVHFCKCRIRTAIYHILANRSPALTGKNLMSLRHPSAHFMLHKGFRVWGTPGSRGRVGRVMLVLRTFPELVGSEMKGGQVG